jgi:hypothetical protein
MGPEGIPSGGSTVKALAITLRTVLYEGDV